MQRVSSAPAFRLAEGQQSENQRSFSKGSAANIFDSKPTRLGSAAGGKRVSLSPAGIASFGRPASSPGLERTQVKATSSRRPSLGSNDIRYARGMATIAQCRAERAEGKAKRRIGPDFPLKALYTVTYPKAYAELEKQKRMKFLHNLFLSADEENTGQIFLEEFQKCVLKRDVRAALSQLGVQPHETVTLFKSMSMDGAECGSVDVRDFMDGLMRHQRKVEMEARAQGLL